MIPLRVVMVSIVLGLSACDAGHSSAVEVTKSPSHKPLTNLARFKGKAPNDLMKDQEIGARIRDVVPVVAYSCMDDSFNYMRDLELSADNSIQSDANGSRADGLRSGFVVIAPDGTLDIVLQCELGKTHQRLYKYFTNRVSTVAAPKSLLQWLRTQALPDDSVRRQGADGVHDIDLVDIEKTTLTFTAVPKTPPIDRTTTRRPVQQKVIAAAPQPETHYVAAGGVICLNAYDFYKVNALEMAHNPYARLPSGCETLGADLPISYFHSVNGFIQVGNSGGTAYIRPRDFR